MRYSWHTHYVCKFVQTDIAFCMPSRSTEILYVYISSIYAVLLAYMYNVIATAHTHFVEFIQSERAPYVRSIAIKPKRIPHA